VGEGVPAGAAFPPGDFGPVLLRAFCRLARICLSLVTFLLSGRLLVILGTL
jgi:hypothetical protein